MIDRSDTVGKNYGKFKLAFFGKMDCPPEWEVVTEPDGVNFCIHYIHAGKGKVKYLGFEYSLSKNDMFLFCPYESVKYVSDREEPWKYYWVSIQGDYIKKLVDEKKIGSAPLAVHLSQPDFLKDCFDRLCQYVPVENEDDTLFYEGVLMLILHQLFSSEKLNISLEETGNETGRSESLSQEKRYVNLATGYMNGHFDKGLDVLIISRYVGLERTYFAKIFKKHTGVTPNHYLTELRIKKAIYLLENSDMPIQDIAASVGYNYTHHFINVFKNHMNITPQQYRISVNNRK